MPTVATIGELNALKLDTPVRCADGQIRRVVERPAGTRALQGFNSGIEVLRERLVHLLPAQTLDGCENPAPSGE